MRFTKYHSYEEIMSYPKMEAYMKIFYSDFLLEMFPENFRDVPLILTEQKGKTPWNEPFSIIVDQFLDAANMVLDIKENGVRKCIPLWTQKGGWELADAKGGGRENVFLVAPGQAYDSCRPAVIICPGGGYQDVCFSGEGNPILHYMEAQGYGAFVLKYRVAPNRYPDPQLDLALAIQYVRASAASYCIDPDNIMVMGFSAGGHLCASAAGLHCELEEILSHEMNQYPGISARPDKVCLGYPVISFEHEPHEGSFQCLTGKREEKRKVLSAENLVGTDYPKTYLWTCQDDDVVPPSNTVRMGEALQKHQIPYEMHLFKSGGHGCGLAFSKDAWEWSLKMLAFM